MIIGSNITLIPPTQADWPTVRDIWEDEATMADVGGIHRLSAPTYRAWYRFMFEDKAAENTYYLIFSNKMRRCVGEVSFHHYAPTTQKAMFNIKIKYAERGRGFGQEAMDLLLDFFFNQWGGHVMEDALAKNNHNGLRVLTNYGFQKVREDEQAVWVALDKETWLKQT